MYSEVFQNLVEKKVKAQKTIRILYWVSISILILILILTLTFYPEPYDVFREFISILGGINSKNGFSNQISSIIMTAGFSIYAVIFLISTFIFFTVKNIRFNQIKGFLNLSQVIGSIGVAIPYDHPSLRFAHSIGAIIFIVGFCLMNSLYQIFRFSRRHIPIEPYKEISFYFDLICCIIILLVFIFYLVIHMLYYSISSPILEVLAPTTQKFVLITNFFFIFLLDVDDI